MKRKTVSGGKFLSRITEIIEASRTAIHRAVNSEMVSAYWFIGREIIREEQKGSERAEYGKKIIETLSRYLSDRYGDGWSPSHLWHVRQFYILYRDRIPGKLHTLRADSVRKIPHTLRAELSWSHYRVLMRADDPKARSFYEAECAANN